MEYAELGRTGLLVSRICLGCMSFGSRKWREWVLEEDKARPIVRAALEAGINFFDTSNSYSLGVSEEITGRALRDFARREEVVVATKVFFPMSDDPSDRGLSRRHIMEQAHASLKRLGTDYIDLYQIHRWDYETPIEETLEALDGLVRQGKVRHLGASSMWAYQFARALHLSERKGWARFETMQNHYNLLYREEEREMNPLCVAEGVALIPWSPLARGMLTGSRSRYPPCGPAPTTTVERSTPPRWTSKWWSASSKWPASGRNIRLPSPWPGCFRSPGWSPPSSARPGSSICSRPWRRSRSAFRRRSGGGWRSPTAPTPCAGTNELTIQGES
jgi:aryl-alcohol dehydrogenase-like predicted oxidoreductase